jgi:hypothetical protein
LPLVIINIFQGNISFRVITLEFDAAPSDNAEEADTQDHGSSGEEDQDTEHSESTTEQEISVDDVSPNENAAELPLTAPSASPSQQSSSGNGVKMTTLSGFSFDFIQVFFQCSGKKKRNRPTNAAVLIVRLDLSMFWYQLAAAVIASTDVRFRVT